LKFYLDDFTKTKNKDRANKNKERKNKHRMTDTTKKEFLERHNITEDELKELVKASGDYDLPKEEFDYGESDDWVWGYGNQQGSNEYIIHISGGGDGVNPNGFEDWVIKKVGGELKYYIRHGGNIPDDEKTGEKLWTCPEGNYVSFQENNSVECYKPREGEMDFEWLEDELEENLKEIRRVSIQVDNLDRANKFLKKITEEQEKKIEKLMNCNHEEYEKVIDGENKLTKEWVDLKNENGVLQEEIVKCGEVHKCNKKTIDELEEEIDNIKKSYETLKSEFQQKRDALQQHNEILMEELCGRPDDEKDKEIEELREKLDGVKEILQTENSIASGIQNRFYDIL